MIQKIKFSECVKYIIKGPFGSDMKKSLYVPKGDNTYKVYIQGNAIQQDETLGEYYVSEEYFHKKLERFEVHPEDYIITCDGTLGKYLKLGDNIERGVISSSLLLLKLDEDKIYDKYFELLWEYSMLGYLASQARNACLIHLPSAKAIGEVEIELPPMDVQIDIANKAYAIKNICYNRVEEICMLDELIKARFVELFGRPEDKKYPSVRLGDYAKLQGGYAFKSKDFVDEGVPLVQIGNVNKDYLDWDVVNAVPEEYIDKYSEFALSKGDLVMAMTRPIIKSLDSVKIAKVAEDDLPCLLNQRVGRFQIKDKIHPVFLEILCKTDDFKDYVERMSGNSLQPNISSKQVEDYIIILPPIELQEKFAEFVEQVDKSKVAVQKSLDETQRLFDSQMQEYFG